MNVIEQLAKLAEAVPDVCQVITFSEGNSYEIGDYIFWVDNRGVFTASENNTSGVTVKGQPAFDWLQCALQRVIRARGWFVELKSYRQSVARIFSHEEPDTIGDWQNTPAEALLDALIKAVSDVKAVEE